ncbi:MAG: hypothetical protein U0841_21855 [Chloroflexia bacterium]
MITAREDGGADACGEGGVGQEASGGIDGPVAERDAAHEMAAPVARDDAVREAEREELGGGVEAAAGMEVGDGAPAGGAELVLDDGELDAQAGRPTGRVRELREGSTATRRAAKWARARPPVERGAAVASRSRGRSGSLVARTTVGVSVSAAVRTRRPRARRRPRSGAARLWSSMLGRIRPAGRSRRAGTEESASRSSAPQRARM